MGAEVAPGSMVWVAWPADRIHHEAGRVYLDLGGGRTAGPVDICTGMVPAAVHAMVVEERDRWRSVALEAGYPGPVDTGGPLPLRGAHG
jgi:hypothetical protein